MKKTVKALSLFLAVPFAAALSFAASTTASAISPSEVRSSHNVGISGSFTTGTADIVMNDVDGDGIWTGNVSIAKVTSDMLDSSKQYVSFKVRLDNSDLMSWGSYENQTTLNNGKDVQVSAVEGQPLDFKVELKTNQIDYHYAGSITAGSDDAYTLWPVFYEIQPSGITLNKTSLTLTSGNTSALTANVTPSNISDKSVSWSTSNSKVATVSNGTVKAVGAGTATITAKTVNGKTAKCTVTVNVLPTSVNLSKTSVTLVKGKTTTIKATVNPSNATDKTVKWKTSNSKVATVSNGKITAKGAGTATITATTSNGKTKTCKVTVKTPPTSVKLNKTSLTIGKGKTATLKATVNPTKNVTSKTVTWTTSNKNVVTVKNGKITAKKVGTATITAKTVNGKIAKCKVTVKNLPSKVKLNKTKASIEADGSVTLKATVSPTNVTSKKVTWSSSNKNIATVNSSGKVTAKKPGTVTITAKTVNGKTAKCKVTVKKINYVNRLKTYIDKHPNGKLNGSKYIKMNKKLGTYNTTTYIINEKSSKKLKVKFTVSGTNPSNYTKATITSEYYLGNSTVKPTVKADYTAPFTYGFNSSSSVNANSVTLYSSLKWSVKSYYGNIRMDSADKNVADSDATNTFINSLVMVSSLSNSRADITIKDLGFTKINL